ncbi:MAG: DUF2182 domain-containing protein [Chromatiales bacterium]|nr:DUF2182 domain-containing protein [Chromatiales bacterium]
MQPNTYVALPPLSHKDKSIVYIGIIAIALMAWLYLFYIAAQHSRMDMSMMGMPQQAFSYHGALYDFLVLLPMWAVMMIAMMLPSILPATAVFAAFNKHKKARAQPYVDTYTFVCGYLVAWVSCGALFALMQSGLSIAGVLDSTMKTNNLLLSGGILLAAGLYQWTSLKEVCLKNCRSPLGFFIERWREGRSGAVYMGWRYGLFCVGCCWALMAIMFSVGTMNILWMAILSIFMLAEKIFPGSKLMRNIAGILLICWGSYLLIGI